MASESKVDEPVVYFAKAKDDGWCLYRSLLWPACITDSGDQCKGDIINLANQLSQKVSTQQNVLPLALFQHTVYDANGNRQTSMGALTETPLTETIKGTISIGDLVVIKETETINIEGNTPVTTTKSDEYGRVNSITGNTINITLLDTGTEIEITPSSTITVNAIEVDGPFIVYATPGGYKKLRRAVISIDELINGLKQLKTPENFDEGPLVWPDAQLLTDMIPENTRVFVYSGSFDTAKTTATISSGPLKIPDTGDVRPNKVYLLHSGNHYDRIVPLTAGGAYNNGPITLNPNTTLRKLDTAVGGYVSPFSASVAPSAAPSAAPVPVRLNTIPAETPAAALSDAERQRALAIGLLLTATALSATGPTKREFAKLPIYQSPFATALQGISSLFGTIANLFRTGRSAAVPRAVSSALMTAAESGSLDINPTTPSAIAAAVGTAIETTEGTDANTQAQNAIIAGAEVVASANPTATGTRLQNMVAILSSARVPAANIGRYIGDALVGAATRVGSLTVAGASAATRVVQSAAEVAAVGAARTAANAIERANAAIQAGIQALQAQEKQQFQFAGVFVVWDDKVLVHVRSAEVKDFQGTISIPGGTPEEGESPTDAAIRELREEAQLTPAPTPADLVELYRDPGHIFYVFNPEAKPSVAGPVAEHAAEVAATPDLTTEEGIKEIVTAAGEGSRHYWADPKLLADFLGPDASQMPFGGGNTMFVKALRVLVRRAPVTGTAPTPDWISDIQVPPACSGDSSRLLTGECMAAAVKRDMEMAHKYAQKNRLWLNPDSALLKYQRLTKERDDIVAKGGDKARLSVIQRELESQYADRQVMIHKGDRVVPFTVINPYRALAYREDVLNPPTFANPTGRPSESDPTGEMFAANSRLLAELAPAEIIADSTMATALLESLWFCGSNPDLGTDPRCFPARALGELREFQGFEAQRLKKMDASEKSTGWSELSFITKKLQGALPGGKIYPYPHLPMISKPAPAAAPTPVEATTPSDASAPSDAATTALAENKSAMTKPTGPTVPTIPEGPAFFAQGGWLRPPTTIGTLNIRPLMPLGQTIGVF